MIGMRKNIGVAEALEALSPGSSWVVRNDSYEGIEWQENNTLLKPTKKEVEEKILELKEQEGMSVVREIRDWYLNESDWTQGFDIRNLRGEEWCKAWDTYRQKLRDITESGIEPYFDENDSLQGVEFPEKPNIK
jgi:hypothetical protein